MNRQTLACPLFVFLLVGVGCDAKDSGDGDQSGTTAGAEADADTDSDADTDTDTDTDADTDADTDTDTDTDTDSDADFVGSIRYVSEKDGVLCDLTFEVAGDRYPGSCADCDFAFDLTSTVVGDASDTDCVVHPALSLDDPTGTLSSVLLAVRTIDETVISDGYYGDYQWDYVGSALSAGRDELGTAGGWSNLSYTGEVTYTGWYSGTYTSDWISPYRAFSVDGEQLSFQLALDDSTTFGDRTDSKVCLGTESVEAGSNLSSGAYTVTGDTRCGQDKVDRYTITLAPGQSATVSVDTVSDADASDLVLHVSDPLGCRVARFDDNFACTYEPPSFRCPTGTITSTSGGTYTLWVSSNQYCHDSSRGGYVLNVDTSADPALTLVETGSDQYGAIETLIDVSMSATIRTE